MEKKSIEILEYHIETLIEIINELGYSVRFENNEIFLELKED